MAASQVHTATDPDLHRHSRRTLGMVSVLLLCALLSDQIQAHGILSSHDLRLWQFFVAALGLLLFCSGRLFVPRAAMVATFLVLLHSVAVVLIGGMFRWFMAAQIVLVAGSFLVFYSALKTLPVSRLPEIYLLAARIVAWSIIFEQLLHAVAPALAASTLYAVMGKWDGPLGLVRAHGLMMEPSQVALILPPAIFICLMQQRVLTALFLLFSAYLTFSGLTYIGLLAVALVYLVITRGIRWQMVVVGALVAILAVAAPPVKQRVVATGKAATLIANDRSFDGQEYFEALRGSVGSVAVATLVSASAFSRNHMLGTGIGLLGTEGERWLESVRSDDTSSLLENTKLFAKIDTGGSLVLRVLGEFGMLGVVIGILGLRLGVRSMRRLRHMVRFEQNWRADWRLQVIGLFIVLLIPYLVRKDGYLNVYLLLPLAGWLLAARELGFVGSRRTVPAMATSRSLKNAVG